MKDQRWLQKQACNTGKSSPMRQIWVEDGIPCSLWGISICCRHTLRTTCVLVEVEICCRMLHLVSIVLLAWYWVFCEHMLHFDRSVLNLLDQRYNTQNRDKDRHFSTVAGRAPYPVIPHLSRRGCCETMAICCAHPHLLVDPAWNTLFQLSVRPALLHYPPLLV